MATIQTYDANPIAEKANVETGFSEAAAVIQGAGQVLESAGQFTNSLEKSRKAADANNLWAGANNTVNELDRFNSQLRAKYANNPNPDKMNQELEQKFNSLTQDTMAGLDEASLNDYRKTAMTTFEKVRQNNNDWAAKISLQLAKQNQAGTAKGLKQLSDNSAYEAGFAGSDYNVGGQYLLRKRGQKTNLEGGELLTPNMPLGASASKVQKDADKNYYLGAIDGMPDVDVSNVDGSVQIGTNEDGTPIIVPTSQYIAEGGKLEPSFWERLKPGRQKPIAVKSRIEVGEQVIDDYYENIVDSINSNGQLSSAEKKDLVNVANTTKAEKKNKYRNGEQVVSANITNALDYAPSFEGMANELESMFRQDDIYSQAQLSRENKGEFGELNTGFNAFSVVKGRAESSANLFSALMEGNGIEGKYTLERLKEIYAPNNTMQENAYLNKVIQASPYLELDLGDEWKNKNQGGNFNETDWYWDNVQSIHEMPDGTAEERAAKTYKIGEFFLQTKKVANNGVGIIDNNLKTFADEQLLGNTTEHLGMYGQEGVGRELTRMIADVRNAKSSMQPGFFDLPSPFRGQGYTADAMESAMNTGLLQARDTLLQTGDVNAAQKVIEDTKFKMLQIKYDGVLDLNKMEQEKIAGRQPIFTYNGTPYVYEGYNGSEIYVRNGNQRKAIK